MKRDIDKMKGERLQPEREVGEHVYEELQGPVVVAARLDSLKFPDALRKDRRNVSPIAKLRVAKNLGVVIYSKAAAQRVQIHGECHEHQHNDMPQQWGRRFSLNLQLFLNASLLLFSPLS